VEQGDDEQGRKEDKDKGEVETARQGQFGVEGVAVIDLRFEAQGPDTQDVGGDVPHAEGREGET
jgi:hypothetical protein